MSSLPSSVSDLSAISKVSSDETLIDPVTVLDDAQLFSMIYMPDLTKFSHIIDEEDLLNLWKSLQIFHRLGGNSLDSTSEESDETPVEQPSNKRPRTH
jgi:hypothetical protein